MPSLLKRPPCVTKYRLRPSDERIAFCTLEGGRVALIRVASGTKLAVSSDVQEKKKGESNTGRKHMGKELEMECE
jgi:DTW domain-containing protein YfiP